MKRLLLSLPLLLCAFSAIAFADDRIGYSTHFDKGQSPDVLMPLIVQSGVRLIRDDCGWGGIEYHAKGTYILGTRDQHFLDVAKASGVKVVLCLQAGLCYGIQYSPTSARLFTIRSSRLRQVLRLFRNQLTGDVSME